MTSGALRTLSLDINPFRTEISDHQLCYNMMHSANVINTARTAVLHQTRRSSKRAHVFETHDQSLTLLHRSLGIRILAAIGIVGHCHSPRPLPCLNPWILDMSMASTAPRLHGHPSSNSSCLFGPTARCPSRLSTGGDG